MQKSKIMKNQLANNIEDVEKLERQYLQLIENSHLELVCEPTLRKKWVLSLPHQKEYQGFHILTPQIYQYIYTNPFLCIEYYFLIYN